MDKLNELENIWQAFKPEVSGKNNLTQIDGSIIQKLKSTEKKHLRINLIKTFTLLVAISLLSYTILKIENLSILSKISFIWIVVCLTGSMVIYWKKQYYGSQFNFDKDSRTFIISTLDKLKAQKKIITQLLPTMVTCLVIGINLLYFDFLNKETTPFRIIAHLSVTVMLYGVMYLGLIVRKRRFKNDFQPLIDELETIYQNLKND